MKKAILSTIMMIITTICQGQLTPNFDGVVGTYQRTLVGTGFNDETSNLQVLVDDVSSQPNGGTIIISGEMTLSRVLMKSNVHIDISKGTVLKGAISPMFDIARRSQTEIENIKIFCSNCDRTKPNDDITEKYVIDISHLNSNDRYRAFQLGNVFNFWISDYYVQDNKSIWSSMSLNPIINTISTNGETHQGLWDYDVIASPTKGDVRYAHGETFHTGYGLIQVQCAKNVNFEQLSGVGGVTLRLESGASIQYVGTENEREHGVVKGIKAYDLFLENGFTCVSMSPHGRINEDVYLDNIRSKSSVYTVDFSAGFFDRELRVLDTDPTIVDPVKFKKGRFIGPIIIKAIHGEFGTSAVGRKVEYDYIEKAFRDANPWTSLPMETSNTRIIASAPPLGYHSIPFEGATPNIVEGEYTATIDGSITSTGFPSCITSFYNNITYEDDRNNVDCSALGISDFKKGDVQFFPNPVIDILTINHPISSSITIYDSIGKLIFKKIAPEATSLIDVTNYNTGLYYFKVTSIYGTKAERIIIK
ncbi:T9SS type A sorting domain-containing protein [Flavivirga amylovorans]|uniref:T9SS type A sorting domain-containing protein n=1 Tax=Flavivirga amylovorans TaxID=870486 RepID=A0ABT8WW57_9FLAO|nr:T9SS type A sorting domain-containing protein [Flavivirga amylovorans]MDO5985842.1 T9SS type A sorting domain-containing protein [Flavivirga amylovorans]